MEMIDIIEKLNHLKDEEKRIADEARELLERFDLALERKEKERLGFEDELLRLSGNRSETRENLRIVIRNILIYKTNLSSIRERLDELEKKGISVKKNYEELLSRPMSNIFALSQPLSQVEVEVAAGVKDMLPDEMAAAAESDISNIEKMELLRTKKEFMTAMNNIFGKYESEIEEIEGEKKRLKEIEDNIIKKDEEAKRQQEILTNSLKAYSDEITKYKNELRASIIEEMRIIEEFNRVIKNIDRSVIVSKEINDILNKISASS